ncbi:MAG: ABC transporter substrate binding protein [Candidatus Vecturithrix sp.]|jgi:hypothetical protein|nr:ABC transporter substrate binding protein [Candidatus Vecturithrix sp.]
MTSLTEFMLEGLKQQGFEHQKNLLSQEMIVMPTDDPTQVVNQIQAAAPDVILTTIEFRNILSALHGLSIPTITTNNVEPNVDAQGMPIANISGIYPTLHDMVFNSYKFLQKVAPLQQGQSVILLNNPEFQVISKETVIEALKRLQIPLKAVVDVVIYEDWQAAILQYSADSEVGWILRSAPTRKRDGSRIDMVGELYPWQREHFNKPTITYWEEPVKLGTLCAFGVDMNEVARQAGRMAARVLQGEPIQTIKAEYPEKISITLNRKTATHVGIVFSMDVLKLANVIYDDYEGKQVIRK